MKSADYWQKRFTAIEQQNHNKAVQAVQSVTPAFDRAEAEIQKEIDSWYARFAKNNQISLQEAKQWLDAKDLKELKWDIDEYIKYGRENALDPKWMKELENASSRYHISRLEALKIRTQQAAEKAFGNETDVLDDLLVKTYTDDYYHTAFEIQKGVGIGWDIGTIDQSKLDKLLKKPWTADNSTFSDRIWKSKTQLIDTVDKSLTKMCILGGKPDDAIKEISHAMGVSKAQAGRLVMTESAYFASAAQKDCFNDLDVEMYEIVATLDNRTSKICQQMDGKTFPMTDFQAGVTAPPFHPWCRSCTVPFFDDEWGREGTRAARDENGKTYQVPADMKYNDWKDHFVDHTKDPADWLKPVSKDNIDDVNDQNIKNLIDSLSNRGVEYREIEKYKTIPSEDDIIQKLSGGDKTRGSCASVGLSYIGQKNGYNVLDFRDGDSREFFSRSGNLKRLSEASGIVTLKADGASAVTVGNRLLKQCEVGKEYYLCCGRHASIVRAVTVPVTDQVTGEIIKEEIRYQYLELQSATRSGWTYFNGNARYTLSNRFGCSSASDGGSSSRMDFMINITDSDFSDNGFKKLLGFINTAENAQKKGLSGVIR